MLVVVPSLALAAPVVFLQSAVVQCTGAALAGFVVVVVVPYGVVVVVVTIRTITAVIDTSHHHRKVPC